MTSLTPGAAARSMSGTAEHPAARRAPPFAAASKEVRDSMRIIARTESTPHIPISVAPWLDRDCATEIAQLLIGMEATPEGRAVLQHNRFTGYRPGDPAVYEKLNELLRPFIRTDQ